MDDIAQRKHVGQRSKVPKTKHWQLKGRVGKSIQ